jgi:hypothetical protein
MSSASPVSAPPPASAAAEARRATAGPGPSADRLDGYGEQSFSFSDFLSIINPLQHIPVVGTIYRAITGDTIKPAQKVIGGLLFGGPMGLVASAFNAIVEGVTGKDFGDQALALVLPERSAPAPEGESQYAAAAPAGPPLAAPVEPEVAPLSRALLGAEPAVDRATALAGAPLPGRGRSLANGPRAGAPAGNGRTLADYRASAGRPLPPIDNGRAGTPTATPVRLQTSTPLGDGARTSIMPSAREAGPVDRDGGPERAAGEPPLEPFVAAMMRGLDRYREMKQAKPAPAVIDATL